MHEIIALGYLGFRATNLDKWRSWATGILGLQEVLAEPEDDDGVLRLRMDERCWRIAVEPVEHAEPGGLAYTGWEVADAGALRRLADRLRAAGHDAVEDPELARLRQVEGLVRCTDPDGYALELFHGQFIPRHPFVSPLGVRFVTGELGLGHILQHTRDERVAREFYLDLLGFRMSDTIRLSKATVHFTHVNPRHHSLAFAAVDGPVPELGHFMVEVDTIDAVGTALDRVNSSTVELTETFGKHTNDHMVSFYMRNPSGSQTEYGWNGRLIDDRTWTVGSYDATAYWGHKVPGSEYTSGGSVSPRDPA